MSAFKRLQIPTRRPRAASNSSSPGVVNDKQCSFDRPGMLTKSGLIETRMWLECGVDSTRSHGGLKNLPRFPSNWIFLPLRHVSKVLQQSSFGLDDRPQILGCEPVDASDWNTNTCPLDCAFFLSNVACYVPAFCVLLFKDIAWLASFTFNAPCVLAWKIIRDKEEKNKSANGCNRRRSITR